MEVFELIIDEKQKLDGVYAISLVSSPAIESGWIALKGEKVELKVVDEERKILMGAALIPNKPIYRKNQEGEEFHVYFSSKTVREASELYLRKGFQSETTLEHEIGLNGNTVVESWIKEDDVNDKSVKYGIDVPVGTWLISMKITDSDVYELAKKGLINGFSIEGKFADKSIKAEKFKTAKELYSDIMKM